MTRLLLAAVWESAVTGLEAIFAHAHGWDAYAAADVGAEAEGGAAEG